MREQVQRTGLWGDNLCVTSGHYTPVSGMKQALFFGLFCSFSGLFPPCQYRLPRALATLFRRHSCGPCVTTHTKPQTCSAIHSLRSWSSACSQSNAVASLVMVFMCLFSSHSVRPRRPGRSAVGDGAGDDGGAKAPVQTRLIGAATLPRLPAQQGVFDGQDVLAPERREDG